MKKAVKPEAKKPKAPTAKAPIFPFEIGKAYFIRTVTYHLTGIVTGIAAGFLLLDSAAWIADSGRFATALASGKLNEVEPVGKAIVNLSAITDAFPWIHQLPTEQK